MRYINTRLLLLLLPNFSLLDSSLFWFLEPTLFHNSKGTPSSGTLYGGKNLRFFNRNQRSDFG